MRKVWLVLLLGTYSLALVSCAGSRPVGSDEYASSESESTGPDTSSGVLGPAGLSLGTGVSKGQRADGDSGATLGVNAYAWRGVLDTLAFMPLESADPYGGVITTGWYQPPSAPGERFKADAYIFRRELQSSSVRLVIFRQVLRSGIWVDAPVSQATTQQIEDKILARAMELRSQVASND
jgi:hypothetical protein